VAVVAAPPRTCSGLAYAGRHRVLAGARRLGVGAERRAGQQLGDAEVEQLHLARRRDEDVGRLQVAVHHEVRVGVRHGAARGREQAQPRRHVEPPGVAVVRDGAAVHVLHHEVRPPVGRHAAVEEAGHVRVVERGEDLPLGREAAHQVGVVGGAREQLDGRRLPVLAVAALGAVDDPHAAAPDRVEQAPGAHARGRGRERGRRGGHARPAPVEQPLGAVVRGEQRRHLVVQPRVAAAGRGEPGGAPVARLVEGVVEQGVRPASAVGGAGGVAGSVAGGVAARLGRGVRGRRVRRRRGRRRGRAVGGEGHGGGAGAAAYARAPPATREAAHGVRTCAAAARPARRRPAPGARGAPAQPPPARGAGGDTAAARPSTAGGTAGSTGPAGRRRRPRRARPSAGRGGA
jgi:hypothetical protein